MFDASLIIAGLIIVGLILFVVLAMVGGSGNALDVSIVHSAIAQRLAHPGLTGAGVAISIGGGAPAIVGLTLLAFMFLAVRQHRRRAITLVGIILGGRLMVELIKAAVARPRPQFEAYPVPVHSLSFPSGHAANSMISFVAIALFCAPPRHRPAALTIAVTASLVIGSTRPLIGVHWPSDVLAGWIFGLVWTLAAWRLLSGWLGAREPA